MKIFKLIIGLIFIPLFIFGQEIEENILLNKHYIARTNTFKNTPLKTGQIVFFGNSITEAGKWAEYFPQQKPANRGISGDNTEGMLARIHEVIVAKPAKLFIMAGINDISLQRSNEVILRNLKMLIRQVQAGSPETKIYIQSLLPMNNEKLKYSRLKDKEIQVENFNTSLKKLCIEKELPYLDVYTQLLASPLRLNPDYTTDGLHINTDAYAIWTEYIKYYVEE